MAAQIPVVTNEVQTISSFETSNVKSNYVSVNSTSSNRSDPGVALHQVRSAILQALANFSLA
jgi:hypothetical protein